MSLDNMTEPELRDMLNRVAGCVQAILPAGSGFIVLATPFGDQGITQYISNVDRAAAIRWMKETIRRFEANDTVPR